MSRIGIISDVHANIEALNLVLKDMEKRNVDKIICLGDLVTKYFYPKEVVDAIKSQASVVIKGNCDNLVATDERYKFARGKLGMSRIEYLDTLPLREQLEINKIIVNLFHATPENIEAMFNPLFHENHKTRYKDNTVSDHRQMFTSSDPQVSFAGHTHQDFIGVENNDQLDIVGNNLDVNKDTRAIVNVGSAGELNILEQDEERGHKTYIHPYLTYAIVDDSKLEQGFRVEMIHVPYSETLKKVYFDMIDKQNKKEAPYSPNDTQKVYDSLKKMNIDVEPQDKLRK